MYSSKYCLAHVFVGLMNTDGQVCADLQKTLHKVDVLIWPQCLRVLAAEPSPTPPSSPPAPYQGHQDQDHQLILVYGRRWQQQQKKLESCSSSKCSSSYWDLDYFLSEPSQNNKHASNLIIHWRGYSIFTLKPSF